jgi:hypothetical protein
MMSAPAEDITIEQAIRIDLARIEARLIAIETKLTAFEQLAAGFMTGPAISKMFAAIKGSRG